MKKIYILTLLLLSFLTLNYGQTYAQGDIGKCEDGWVWVYGHCEEGKIKELDSNNSKKYFDTVKGFFEVKNTPITGECGTSNGLSFDNTPTENLCTIGIASEVSGTGPWNWTCKGTNGGADANCSANINPIDGTCGTSNGLSFDTKPTENLCGTGTTSEVSGEGPWNWTCNGEHGGADATCSANINPINGECGTANGKAFDSKPTNELCSVGEASSVSGNGPWEWTCSGQHLGNDAVCKTETSYYSIYGSVLEKDTNKKLSGVKIELLSSTGTILNSFETDNDGNYNFLDLTRGIYKIKETVLEGYKAISDFDGGNATETSLELNKNENNINFILEEIKTLKPTGGSVTTKECKKDELICVSGVWQVRGDIICESDLEGEDCGEETPKKPEEPEVPEEPKTEKPEVPELNSAPEPNPNDDIKKIKNILEKHYKNEETLNIIKRKEYEIGESEIINNVKELIVTGTPIFERIKTIKQKNIETEINKDDFRLAGAYNFDLNYWLSVLSEQDKYGEKFIVIPSSGLVMPINSAEKNSDDYKNYINGIDFDYYRYLENGALEIPGTSTKGYGEVGNKVIIGHSSYWKNKAGRYKTQFQKIIELDAGEEIWIYERNILGKYTRYRYEVKKSYETTPNDISVQYPGVGKNLTLYTCTPIGGTKGRWIVKAKYIEEGKNKLEKEINFSELNSNSKEKISKFIEKASKEDLYRAFKKIEEKEKNGKYDKFIKLKIAQKLMEK